MAMLKANHEDMKGMFKWLGITFMLGFSFLIMELYEFYHFSSEGATIPQQRILVSILWSRCDSWITRICRFSVDDRAVLPL